VSAQAAPTFPWGERDPEGGYRVGDRVGVIHSDHEEYIFDNPTGVITAIEQDGDGPVLTVSVNAEVTPDQLYLIERGTSS
jgi:hypothetical protein